MIANKILALLEGVRRKGDQCWIAKCPAHEDRSPSLTIREVEDRLLIHCFAGCSATEVIQSVGLEFSDLFPERIQVEGNHPIKKKRFPAEAVLAALAEELVATELGLAEIKRRGKLGPVAMDRMNLALQRITAGRMAGGWI